MSRYERSNARPALLQVSLAAAGLLLFAALYVLLMRIALPGSQLETVRAADDRDLAYLAIHLGLLAGGAIAGFFLGKWLSGLGLAFALLFVVVLSVSMVAAQIGNLRTRLPGPQRRHSPLDLLSSATTGRSSSSDVSTAAGAEFAGSS